MAEPANFIASASEGLLYQPPQSGNAPKLVYQGIPGTEAWKQNVLKDQPSSPTRVEDPENLSDRDVQPIERCSCCKNNACCIARIVALVLLAGAAAYVIACKPFSN